MTVGELRRLLSDKAIPDNMDVCIRQTEGEYSVSQAEIAKVKNVRFSDDSSDLEAWDDVLIITDDIFYDVFDEIINDGGSNLKKT